jgi:hypothetical protein
MLMTDTSILEFTATKATGSGFTFERPIHRKVNGKIEAVNPDFAEEYGVPNPSRYILEFSGYSDVFEEQRYNSTDPDDLVERVVIEFLCTNKKAKGTRFSQAFNLPKDWTDDRGKLHQLFSAIQGRPIVDGDAISFAKSLGKTFEGVVDVQMSAKGNEYALVKTFLAMDQEDDDEDDRMSTRGRSAPGFCDGAWA